MNDGFGLEGGLARFLVFKASVFAAILPIEIGHTWEGPILTKPLMLRFSNSLALRCHFTWWQYRIACALESCCWRYWKLDGFANPWVGSETENIIGGYPRTRGRKQDVRVSNLTIQSCKRNARTRKANNRKQTLDKIKFKENSRHGLPKSPGAFRCPAGRVAKARQLDAQLFRALARVTE